QHALDYEVKRQARALDDGGRLVQETRLWDPDRAQTVSMRSKEYAHDYRYFPEPDLPPLQIELRWIDEVRASLPELPAARRPPRRPPPPRPTVRALVLRGRYSRSGTGACRLLRGGRPRVSQTQDRGQLGAERTAPRGPGR